MDSLVKEFVVSFGIDCRVKAENQLAANKTARHILFEYLDDYDVYKMFDVIGVEQLDSDSNEESTKSSPTRTNAYNAFHKEACRFPRNDC